MPGSSHPSSDFPESVVLRWGVKAFLLGLFIGAAAAINALVSPQALSHPRLTAACTRRPFSLPLVNLESGRGDAVRWPGFAVRR
jgi:hypothetical protein